jgi:UDP-N-acetylglucosamine diphosphorylase/glucosamine-1-phosphate N-acetyltransferase
MPTEEELLAPHEAPPIGGIVEMEGRLLDQPWDLVDGNADRIRRDVSELFGAGATTEPSGVHHLGEGPLSIGEGVILEPGVVLDTRLGPIRLDDGVRVHALTRLEGPAYVGQDSVILGGAVSRLSAGPVCQIRGEVEDSVILGYSNKAHDGFLGHAYAGRWVNLGALTTNSDLKNNYNPVRVGARGGEVDTGLLKVGCFLGDHVKTGIGTLLNTGTVVGAGSSVFGGSMPPKYVPPFSWGSGPDLGEFRLDDFMRLAERVMARRGATLREGQRSVLTRAWEATRSERV